MSAPVTYFLLNSQECDCDLTDAELDTAFDTVDVESALHLD